MASGKYHKWITAEGLIRVEGWATDGLTDEEIAKNMGVTAVTLYSWKKKFPQFEFALKQGKEVVDRKVEKTLLQRALGYDYEERETWVEGSEDGEKKTRTKITRRHALPDVTAQIFWLKNRRPVEWRDRKDIAVSGKVNNPFEGITTEELKKLIRDG